MKRMYLVGLSLCSALLLTVLILFSAQQQAAAQIVADPEDESEIVAITPIRLDGQVVLSVTVRVGEDLTVTTPITLDVASWVADLEGTTAITAGVAVGEPALTVTAGVTSAITSTLTSTVDVTVTGVTTPVLSLVELLEEEIDEEDEDAEPVQRGEVLFPSNLRAGPSTEDDIVGNAQPGDIVVIVDTNAAGDWYNLEGGEWIAGFLVQLLDPDAEAADPDEAEADEADEVDEPVEDEATEDEAIEDEPVEDEAAEDEAVEDDATEDESPLMPAPTPTPAPEQEAVGSADDDQEDTFAYRVSVITGLLNLASGVEAMGGLMDDPQMLSVAWNDSIKDQATVIRGSYQEISTLTPPPDDQPFHNDLLAALVDCDAAMELLTNGLDSLDMNALDQAATLMIQCGEKMETVVTVYPEFLE